MIWQLKLEIVGGCWLMGDIGKKNNLGINSESRVIYIM